MNPDLKTSVVVPVHRGGAAFRLCLESLARLDAAPAEIIVVLDGDDATDRATASEFGVSLLAVPGPGGPARARNTGARAARGAIVFFVDADVTVASDAVARIVGAFGDDPGLAAAIGSYDDQPEARGLVTQFKNLSHHWVHQSSRAEAFTFWGACGAVRRAVFESVGGFDESYPRPAIEDIELGYRLVGAGHRIAMLKDLQVKHHKRWTLASMLRSDFFDRGLPWTELILRHGKLGDDLNLGRTGRLSVLASGLLLAALIAGVFFPAGLWVALLAGIVLVAANQRFYRFVQRKRGLLFAIACVPLHWLHYLTGGLAFAVGALRHVVRPRR